MRVTIEEALQKYALAGVHPAANLFPMMSDDEYEGLKADADKNGWIAPVVITSDDLLLDGRNRLCASIEIQKDVRIIRLDPPDPVAYVVGLNLHRRQLTVGQKALIALEIEKIYAQEGKQRKIESGIQRVQSERNEDGTWKAVQLGTPVSQAGCKVKDRLRELQEQERKSATRAAKVAGVSSTAVKQAKAIVKSAPAEVIEKVQSGELCLKRAYTEVKQQERLKQEAFLPAETAPIQTDIVIQLPDDKGNLIDYPKPKGKVVFNETNDAVEWAGWTWNPVTGCRHGCHYCYAREIALSAGYRNTYPNGFDPLFHWERLSAPADTPYPAEKVKDDPKAGRVFVCSMADLFGAWVPQEWIDQVMQATLKAPHWEYLFLTKFPQRLHRLTLPPSAWIGASIDTQQRAGHTLEALKKVDGVKVKWLSIEPLLEPLELDLYGIDWIVIGAQSGTKQPTGTVPGFAPDFEWVMSLVDQARWTGTAVYMKSNLLGKVNDQWPGMKLIQELPRTVTNKKPSRFLSAEARQLQKDFDALEAENIRLEQRIKELETQFL